MAKSWEETVLELTPDEEDYLSEPEKVSLFLRRQEQAKATWKAAFEEFVGWVEKHKRVTDYDIQEGDLQEQKAKWGVK